MERGGLTIVLIASLAFFSVVLVRFSIPSLLPYLIGLNGINTVMGGLIISASGWAIRYSKS